MVVYALRFQRTRHSAKSSENPSRKEDAGLHEVVRSGTFHSDTSDAFMRPPVLGEIDEIGTCRCTHGPGKKVVTGTIPTNTYPCFSSCAVSFPQQIFIKVQATGRASSQRRSNTPAPVAAPKIEHNVVRAQLDNVEHAATTRSRQPDFRNMHVHVLGFTILVCIPARRRSRPQRPTLACEAYRVPSVFQRGEVTCRETQRTSSDTNIRSTIESLPSSTENEIT